MSDNQQFAVELMNRAGLTFDVPDVGLACSVVEQLKCEIAAWLDAEMRGVVIVADLIEKMRNSAWKENA